ncbi:MAG: AAA family ATPase, partial [Polyangiaceae bacterium]
MAINKLSAAECRLVIEPESLNMQTTDDVQPLSGIASQQRALKALEFGLDIRQPRFHVVAVGDPGSGRTFSARSVARRLARQRPTPDDVLLLPNPKKPSEPTVLQLPPSEGRPFVEAMEELHENLVEGLQGVPDGERFKHARARVERSSRERESELEASLSEVGEQFGLEIVRNDDEINVIPGDGDDPDSDVMRDIAAAVEEFEEALVELQEELDRELRGVLKRLMVESVHGSFSPVKEQYTVKPTIHLFLEEVESLVIREIRHLIDETRGDEPATLARGIVVPTLLTEHEPDSGAPVIDVPYPTLTALFGRSHLPPDGSFPPEPGFAVAGALHQANGGFLILPANTLLKNGIVYEQLKACLLACRFIPPEHEPSYFRGTVEELAFPPIPIDVKV